MKRVRILKTRVNFTLPALDRSNRESKIPYANEERATHNAFILALEMAALGSHPTKSGRVVITPTMVAKVPETARNSALSGPFPPAGSGVTEE